MAAIAASPRSPHPPSYPRPAGPQTRSAGAGLRGLAFTLRGHAQLFPITGFAGLPLTFASTALVPLSLMPDWLAVVAQLNPMTYAIDAVRSLVLAGWQPAVLARTLGALLLFDAGCLAVAGWVLRRGLR